MGMRLLSFTLLVLALAACQPRAPDSGLGVSNDSYATYREEQRRRAVGGLVPDRPVISPERLDTGTPQYQGPLPQRVVDTVERETAGNAEPEGIAPPPVERTSPPLPEETPRRLDGAIGTDNPGISDSQDFEAVSERRTREQDAERLREQRENYRMIPAEPLPKDAEIPSIASFALSTRHPVGQKMYRRSIFDGLFGSPCEDYATPDDAQLAFLEAGGPERDQLGLDPDGDGYACGWSPEPYRRMAR